MIFGTPEKKLNYHFHCIYLFWETQHRHFWTRSLFEEF